MIISGIYDLLQPYFLKLKKYYFYIFFIMVSVAFGIHTSFGLKHYYYEKSSKLIIIAISLFFIFSRFLFSEKKLHKFEVLFLIYSIITSLSAIIAGNFAFVDITHPIIGLIVFIGISSYLTIEKPDEKKIIIILAIFLVYPYLHLFFLVADNYSYLLQFFLGNAPYENTVFMGLTHNQNVFGLEMMLGAMISLSLTFYKIRNGIKGFLVYLYVLSSMLFVLFTFLSGSRASLLGIFALILLTIFFSPKIIIEILKNLIHYKYSAILSIIAAIAAVILFFPAFEFFFSKFKFGTSMRTALWEEFFLYNYNKFPSLEFFFGYGFTGLKAKVVISNPDFYKYHLHNMFFEIWGRFGLFSLFSIIIVYINMIKNSIRINKLWFLVMIPLAFIIHDMFEVVLVIRVTRWEVLFFNTILIIPLIFQKYNSDNIT